MKRSCYMKERAGGKIEIKAGVKKKPRLRGENQKVYQKRLEKDLKRKDTIIIDPQEYINIFSKYGKVKILGKDVPVFDFKTCVAENIKAPGQLHFQFAPAKRLKLIKDKNTILIKGETTYKSDLGVFKSFLKKGKNFHFKPELLPLKVPVKKEKLEDVNKLLKQHFGPNWMELSELDFYKNLLSRPDKDEIQEEMEEIQDIPTELSDELTV
ncbi:uncharacterized protein LOC115875259 [Sitophilus oryzae]|uniref:Uncharacterized protein LOC115875259 n=1 Tax=Sitophilus oryzae TaxID=7048 RepID=A0A6J2X5T8_SITOR|nr:uncharacterized protein LOC115875259 [Sitophilus oryzae]